MTGRQDGGHEGEVLSEPSSSSSDRSDQPPMAALDRSVRDVGEAARSWGIARETAEGEFVSAFMAAVSRVGQVAETSRAEFARLFEQNREAARDELARAKEITKAANIALSQARNAQLTYVVEQENVVVRMIDKTLPLFIEKMQGTLVLREKRLNARILYRRYVMVGLVTLGLFAGGYAVRLWQDAEMAGFLGQCLAHPYQSGGHVFCDVTRFASSP